MSKLLRFWLNGLVLALLLPASLNVLAEDEAESPDGPPLYIVRGIVDEFSDKLRHVRGKPQDVKVAMIGEIVDQHLSSYLDIERMSREIFGEHWATLEEQELTLQAMGRVRTSFRDKYVRALEAYDRQRIRVFGKKNVRKPEDKVHVKIDASIKTLPVDVYFHQVEDGEWLIYDVRVLGTSFVEAGHSVFQKGIKFYGLEKVLNEIEMTVQ